MHNTGVWKRADLQFPQPFNTIFFDIDGILINTQQSFHEADIAVAEYVTGTLNGLDWGQQQDKRLFTFQDIDVFKRAGGYNNEWDLCYLLTTLATTRLREWRGTELAARTIQEWAELSRAANLRGHGGREWVRNTFYIGGSLASAVYGMQQLAKDIDLVVELLPDPNSSTHDIASATLLC